MRWVLNLTGQVITLGIEHPSHGGIVDRHAQRDAQDLRKEYGALGDVHVVPYFLVLEHVLRSVPSIAGNGPIHLRRVSFVHDENEACLRTHACADGVPVVT